MSHVRANLGVPYAQKQSEVTSVTLANATAKQNKHTCGAGKRQLILSVKMANPDDVQRTMRVVHYKEAALTNLIKYLTQQDIAAGGMLQWPNSLINNGWILDRPHLVILDAGETLELNWASGGASTGGTDADGQVVEYLEIDYP